MLADSASISSQGTFTAPATYTNHALTIPGAVEYPIVVEDRRRPLGFNTAATLLPSSRIREGLSTHDVDLFDESRADWRKDIHASASDAYGFAVDTFCRTEHLLRLPYMNYTLAELKTGDYPAAAYNCERGVE